MEGISSVGKYEDIRGKKVLVTGGSGGIGRAAALAFGANGASVVVLARNEAKLKSVVEDIEKLGGKGFYVVADLEKPSDWERSVRESVAKLGGGLDVLVCNGPGTVEAMRRRPESVEAFQASFNVNVLAIVALVNTALPRLLESKGCVISISSAASVRPYPGVGAYCAAKAACDAFIQNYALTYAKRGVRFNSILPSSTRTPAMEEQKKAFGVNEAMFAKVAPVQRLADAVEQASVILFLASSAAAYITGVQLPVDGGFLLTSWSSTSHMLQIDKQQS